SSNSFSATGNLGVARDGPGLLLPNGKVLIAGSGQDGCVPMLASTELYNPATGTFAASASLGTPRSGSKGMTLLPNGKVLVSGGVSSTCGYGASLSSSEIYQ